MWYKAGLKSELRNALRGTFYNLCTLLPQASMIPEIRKLRYESILQLLMQILDYLSSTRKSTGIFQSHRISKSKKLHCPWLLCHVQNPLEFWVVAHASKLSCLNT